LALGAWSLMRNQRGAEGGPAPVVLPPHAEPSRARCGCPRGRFGCGWPRRPRGEGTGAGPNRADARIGSTLRCRGLPGRRLMHGRGLPGPMHESVDIIREQKTKNNENHDKTPSPQTPIGGPPVWSLFSGGRELSSCRGRVREWASRESHDTTSWRKGPCSRGSGV
jgi:hypothetical protein